MRAELNKGPSYRVWWFLLDRDYRSDQSLDTFQHHHDKIKLTAKDKKTRNKVHLGPSAAALSIRRRFSFAFPWKSWPCRSQNNSDVACIFEHKSIKGPLSPCLHLHYVLCIVFFLNHGLKSELQARWNEWQMYKESICKNPTPPDNHVFIESPASRKHSCFQSLKSI